MEIFIRNQTFERKKIKKKMSKAEMQLAIIKKKKCDAKALTIVEQLLESKIDSQWLLSNLKYINKNHMEDVIEERAIIKLCGYVLCNNALKTITDQRYHISTKKNKVYDITRRKNFCSSHCYGASNYLLEQMLTSPLWLRDKEEIPEFQILLTKDKFIKNVVGDEIYVKDKMIMNPENTDKYIKNNKNCRKNMLPNKCSELNACNEYIKESSQINENIQTINIIKNSNVFKEFSKNLDETSEDIKNVSINSKDNSIKNFINDDTVKEIYNSKDNKINTIIQDTENINNDVIFSNENKDYNIKSEEKNEVFETSTTEYNINIITQDSINSNNDKDLMYVCKQKIKQKKFKQNSVKEEQSDKFYNLTIHIEHNVKEWITKDTIALLRGIEDIKNQLLENIIQHDRYLHLCKKLNKLQMEDEKDDCIDLTANILKPLPHLSILQEEGKRMELKVRAFYKGSMIIENHKNSTEVIEQDNDFIPVLPLTDAHTPKKLRRRIFLDKLNKILPDLFNALTKNKLSQYVYNSEKSTLIKVLINTFSLSASNVIFKTAEWTLVGLIIIKMLSMIDPELKCLLSTKQALMYISMILMSYKLDSNYLERLIMELINN
ncbi:RNA polymerase II subunit B1 CTD phosphatase Rpap2 [Apis mellifera]|uniref:RNA polymerase II subunit B1 CTD phosphatase RPAP2 homolog n=1 Tax=Apis mellifera TaxID=7460 RepID=A0A7M7MKX5_APIME|nr:RNA polymerase II subunit B1 CTD phosphatase Rpap2 [Apis mellifera]|eukprot:XP_026297509.1 RNA polymerase II subunit B1 CTD phosphatase Rpap2 [Apis mellifera]